MLRVRQSRHLARVWFGRDLRTLACEVAQIESTLALWSWAPELSVKGETLPCQHEHTPISGQAPSLRHVRGCHWPING